MSEMESRPPVWMLDAEKIGTALVWIAVAASQLGHDRIQFTATDYLTGLASRGASPEVQFVRDILAMPVDEVISPEERHVMIRNRPRWNTDEGGQA